MINPRNVTLTVMLSHIVPQSGESWDYPSQLDIINVDHPSSCEERCKVMLRKWLQLDPFATWGKLVDAIHSLDVTVSFPAEGL